MDYREVAPCVFIYDNAWDKCEGFIKEAARGLRQPAFVGPGPGEVNPEVRNCSHKVLDASLKGEVENFLLAKKIFEHADHYGNMNSVGFSDMESLQLLHYIKSNEYYKPHSDDGPGYPRIFSAVLYLNDVKEGGETRFTKFDLTVKPKRGQLLLFPSNYAYEHEALPPISEDKFVVVTWFTPVMK